MTLYLQNQIFVYWKPRPLFSPCLVSNFSPKCCHGNYSNLIGSQWFRLFLSQSDHFVIWAGITLALHCFSCIYLLFRQILCRFSIKFKWLKISWKIFTDTVTSNHWLIYRRIFVYIFPFISICAPVSNKVTEPEALYVETLLK